MVAKKAGVSTTAMPAKRIDHVGVGGNSDGIGSLISARLERGHGAAMLEVAQSPVGEDGDESKKSRPVVLGAASGPFLRAPISSLMSENSAGRVRPSVSTTRRTGSAMKTMSQEIQRSENGQKGRTP